MSAPQLKHAWLPLAWALTALSAVPVHAQVQTYTYRTRTTVPAPPAVDFSYSPAWQSVPGTNVLMVRPSQRPNYDLFGYGSEYYIYNNGYWYQAEEWDGAYMAIRDTDVPRAVRYVPQREWNNYPTAWTSVDTQYDNDDYNASNQDNGYYDPSTDTYRSNGAYDNNGYRRSDGAYNSNYDHRNDRAYSNVYNAPPAPPIYFRNNPHWVKVPGTSVMVVRQDERPNVDLFYHGGNYYTHDNGYWYRSNGWNGPYTAIQASVVPGALRSVPRSQWISYPSNWNGRTYQNTTYKTKKHRTVVKTTTRRY